MSILFVGSAPEDLGGAAIAYTGARCRDPNFTPVASEVKLVQDGGSYPFNVNFAPATDEVWLHFRLETNRPNYQVNAADGILWDFYSANTRIGYINCSNDEFYFTFGGVSVEISITENIAHTFDFRFFRDGVNYTVDCYQGGALQATATWASALPIIDSARFVHSDVVYYPDLYSMWYSEFIVTDGAESTLGWRVATLEPNLAGTHTAWDGVPANLVNFGDGLGISTPTPNVKESWTLSAYAGPATSSGVRAVVNKLLANTGASGPTQMTPFIRHAATDVDGTVFTPNGSIHMDVMDTNPQTTLGWDTADLAALEIGVKSTA